MGRGVIVTFKRDGIDCITTVSSIDNDPIGLLHKNDVRRQLAEWARKTIKTLDKSDISLGYDLETMPKFTSKITNAQVRHGEQWDKKLYQVIENNLKNGEQHSDI